MTQPQSDISNDGELNLGSAVATNVDGSAASIHDTCPTVQATLMNTLVQEVRTYDEATIKGIKEDIETVLTFAGLFSASLTAFAVESFKQLQPDTHNATVFLLATIARDLNNSSVDQSFLTTFRPSPVSSPSKYINALWLSSLFLSLVTASLAMLAKQWLREFLDLHDTPRKFLQRHRGLTVYRVYEISAFLPLFLQLALLSFFIGLSIFIHTLDPSIGWSITILVVLWVLLYLISLVLPAFSYSCPYKTPMLTHIRGFILHSLGAGALGLAVWVLTGVQQFAECFGFHTFLVDTIQTLNDARAKSGTREKQAEETDLYSIRQVKCKFHHLAPPGRENTILRKLVRLIVQLDLYNLIIEWVTFMGGLKSIPADLRPMIRMSIVEAGSASSSGLGWEDRFRMVFADIADSADLQALLDICKHLISKYKKGDQEHSDVISCLLTFAMNCRNISVDHICSLIRCADGLKHIPADVLPHVRRYLIRHIPTRFPSSGTAWLQIIQILVDQTGTLPDDIKGPLFASLPASLNSIADISALVRACNGMRTMPDELRPLIRANVIRKPAGAVHRNWALQMDILFDSLGESDAPHFTSLLQDALTSLKSYMSARSLPVATPTDADFESYRHTFMSAANSRALFLVEYSSEVPMISNKDIPFLMTWLLPRKGTRNGIPQVILSELSMCIFLILHMDPECLLNQYGAIERHLIGWEEVLRTAMNKTTLLPDDGNYAHDEILLRKLGTQHVVLQTAADSLRETLRQLQQRRPSAGSRPTGSSENETQSSILST